MGGAIARKRCAVMRRNGPDMHHGCDWLFIHKISLQLGRYDQNSDDRQNRYNRKHCGANRMGLSALL
ncbi:hypothetical protein [Natronohydrobacter thiooxidans]|uniref:hypothetical protein n=1 Tax=Natronohydrobacter thiooxidans TaxID=87172 RepID=UPI001114824C|nr:hypothetical protein [Natronohydrobacter thiooxidans]